MKRVKVQMNGEPLTEVGLADNYFLRLRGLIGRDPAAIGGLLIKPCNQIHMFFMSVPLDVVYLDKAGTVLQIDAAVPVNKCCRAVRGAKCVLELPAGKASELKISENSILSVVKIG